VFDFTDAVMIAAVFLGPIVAVRLTRYLDDKKEQRQRKKDIFRALMSTRASGLSPVHVEALNLIDVEFDSKVNSEKAVVSAWRAYHDHLGNTTLAEEAWSLKKNDLFTELLHAMAVCLKYDFDKTYIKNSSYFPRGHGEIENDQTIIRRGFRALLEGRMVIPMHVTNFPDNETPPEGDNSTEKVRLESN